MSVFSKDKANVLQKQNSRRRLLELAEVINRIQAYPDIVVDNVVKLHSGERCKDFNMLNFSVRVTRSGNDVLVSIVNMGTEMEGRVYRDIVVMAMYPVALGWTGLMIELRKWYRSNYGVNYRIAYTELMDSIKRMPSRIPTLQAIMLRWLGSPSSFRREHTGAAKGLPDYKVSITPCGDGTYKGTCRNIVIDVPVVFQYKLGDDLRIHYARIAEQVYGV